MYIHTSFLATAFCKATFCGTYKVSNFKFYFNSKSSNQAEVDVFFKVYPYVVSLKKHLLFLEGTFPPHKVLKALQYYPGSARLPIFVLTAFKEFLI